MLTANSRIAGINLRRGATLLVFKWLKYAVSGKLSRGLPASETAIETVKRDILKTIE